MKERESNIELLRIILIIMVLGLHYLNAKMGGALGFTDKNTFNFYFIHAMESAFIIAVNVFILITGYFMIKKEKISIKKVCELVAICIFYGVVIFALVVLFNDININKNTLKTFLFTIINRWFIVIYIILYLLIPYINRVVNSISKKQLKCLIIIMLIFFSIWPTFISTATVRDNGYGIINFVLLYLIGGYIRLYKDEKQNIWKYLFLYLLMTIITTSYSLKFARAWHYNCIFNIISSISLFLIFKNIKFKNKVINKLSKYTLSVYIIHENSFIVRYIYQVIFKTPQFYNNKFLPVHFFATIITLYIACIVIDVIRKFIFKYTVDRLLNCKIFNKEISA